MKILNHFKPVTGFLYRHLWVLIFVFPLLFLIRFYLQDLPIKELWNPLDDWFRYNENAENIVELGWMKNQGNEPYYGPGGFLYNYFLALIKFVFGRSLYWIYFVQSLVLGCTFFLFLRAFKQHLNGVFTPIILLVFLFLFLDVFWHYNSQLLSENLFVLFYASSLYFLTIREKPYSVYLFSIGVGLMILTRPALSIMYPIFAWMVWEHGKTTRSKYLSLFLSLLLIQVLAIRNFWISGYYVWLPTEGSSDSLGMLSSLDFQLLTKKASFQLGFCSVLNDAYQIRWHWILLVIGYFVLIFRQILSFGKLSFPLLHLLLWSIFLSNLLFVKVDSYGFRSVLPFILLMLWLVVESLTREVFWRGKWK